MRPHRIANVSSASLSDTKPSLGLTEVSSAPCPICAAPTPPIRRLEGWGYWCNCVGCDLEFAQPLTLPERPEEMFTRAYQGEREESGMREFAYRLSIRTALLQNPKLWFLPGCIDEILRWLKREVSPGATVLDIGCGPGFFLHTLRREGFNPVGLDVALPAVEVNRREGFKVWHGVLDTMPQDFVKPDAIVSLFMIHHLEDPFAFFKTLVARWPLAPVAVAEYGRQRGKSSAAALPPRTLTRWTKSSLAQVIARAGYSANSIGLCSTGSEHTILRPVRSVMRRTIKVPRIYRLSRRIQRQFLPVILRPLQQQDYTVVGFGEPPLKA